jgi:8-oxo-dGTP pyrophosphatase MutT (NUDIX family)
MGVASAFDLAVVKEELGGHADLPEPPQQAHAAVATVLRQGREGAEALLIKRAERSGDPWSGHVAFPGGKREPGESLLLTALRETEEEVGLRLSPSALVSRMQDVEAGSSGYRVAHFVLAFDDVEPPALTPNAEVAATLWVPLERFARFEGAGTFAFAVDGRPAERPCFRLGDYVLWGMTYRMVLNLLDALTPLA